MKCDYFKTRKGTQCFLLLVVLGAAWFAIKKVVTVIEMMGTYNQIVADLLK